MNETPSQPTPRTSRGAAPFLAVIAVIAIAAAAYFAWQWQKSSPGSSSLSLNERVFTPDTLTKDPSTGVSTYTSPELGVRFSFASSAGITQTLNAVRVGNRLYVSPATMKPEDGQWIEVYAKNEKESLTDAIATRFLKGFDQTICTATAVDNPVANAKTPTTFSFAEIKVPFSENEDMQVLFDRAAKCPAYTLTNGVAYFFTDSKHPMQFAFVNIGQYPIEGGNGKLWQDTVEFLK